MMLLGPKWADIRLQTLTRAPACQPGVHSAEMTCCSESVGRLVGMNVGLDARVRGRARLDDVDEDDTAAADELYVLCTGMAIHPSA